MEIMSKRIRSRRKALNISTKQFANMLFLSQSAVGQWERDYTIPKIDMIPAICEALQCTPNYLFGYSDKTNG